MWITPTPSRFAGHLSPLKGERKGACDHGRCFLSPVERGRGGREADGVGVDPRLSPNTKLCIK
jgi:hypothetical protein